MIPEMILGDTYFKNTSFVHFAIKRGKTGNKAGGFVHAHPPELGRMLLAGEVDVAPVSSIIYAQNPGRLFILPDFSISGRGETGSILLFSKFKSLESLSGRSFATPSTSASSTALLEIILAELGIDAAITRGVEPRLETMLSSHDAALLIGDHALRAGYYSPELVLTDLGMEWQRLTGKSMVYALWLSSRARAGKCYRALISSRNYAMENFDYVAGELAREAGLPRSYLASHLRKLEFALGEEELEGLEHYYRLAKKHGIIAGVPLLNFAEVR